jgi:hypothetical protein
MDVHPPKNGILIHTHLPEIEGKIGGKIARFSDHSVPK